MIDRFEILYSRLRRLVSRNRWSARLLGYPPLPPTRDGGIGLVLIQVDGLGRQVLDRAIAEGRMPFLRQLIEDDAYRLRNVYSGLPSSTPGAQGELFYRARTFVPAFGFWDREVGKVVRMNDPATAARVESKLVQEHDGLFRDGSAWSNIYAGEAAEPHLCASTTGLDMLLKALDPTRFIGLILWHGWSVVRVAANLVAETLLAFWDVFRGTIAGRDFFAELRFIPPRVVVTALMREIITAGAAIDCERGLPIIQLNYLGYDEHGHRRGPDSRFALWTLKGIDRSIRRVWLAAHRSPRRDYQIWIFSDHGQEATRSYPLLYGEDVRTAVTRIHEAWKTRATAAPPFDPSSRTFLPPNPPGEPSRTNRRNPSGRGRRVRDSMRTQRVGTEERRRWLEQDLPEWLARSLPGEFEEVDRRRRPGRRLSDVTPPRESERDRPEQLEVVHQGPVGFVYLEETHPHEEIATLARSVARQAHIPAVLFRHGPGRARGFLADGSEVHLPEDTVRVVGADHPFLPEVTEDLLRVVHHPDAGDLTLLGYSPDGAMSLQLENGAHGGPGPRETCAFAVVPREACEVPPERIRMSTLYDLARAVLAGRSGLGAVTHREGQDLRTTPFRIVTYNVHSCRGMDGVYSPNRIARALLREQPDIICLQELEHGIGRSGWALQVTEIAEALSADYHFHGISRVDDGDFGNAILSPHRMERVKSGSLPVWAGKRRGTLWVTVEIDGRKVNVLNTHLSIVEKERKMQADALVGPEWLGNGEVEGPLVLCGDFNASGRSYTGRTIGGRLTNVESGNLAIQTMNTWSSRVPLRRIDHVFVSEEIRVRQTYVTRTRLTRVASDHLPLVVDLEFEPRSGAGPSEAE